MPTIPHSPRSRSRQSSHPRKSCPPQIDRWFDSVMDRVSQRFALHTRLWTVFFSVLLAFALHLDAFRLLTQLSTDAELRARLVASADALVHKADETLAPPAAAICTSRQ